MSALLLLTTNTLCLLHQNEEDVDYDDPFSVQSNIEDTWWLTSNSCKYLLCCLVRKDCKDINRKPCEHFTKLAVWKTLLATTTSSIAHPHVTLDRERKGGIVVFIFVGTERK